jgi:glycosyltransferase involved in cell wall biosynthesis
MIRNQQPFVSCIMPTYNRREFVPHAIRYFLRQDYENKELIVIDDGEDVIQDLIPQTETLRYYRLDKKISLGAKLNLACQYSKGEIIAHWDDDDWYAPRRLQYQVTALENDEIDVCGINKLLYYDVRNKQAYRYVYPPDQRTWLIGSSLCYKKEVWDLHHFADINVGMDGLFVWAMPPGRIKVLPDSSIAVHTIHDNNVSPKKTNDSWWHIYPVGEIEKIMDTDWIFYRDSDFLSGKKPSKVQERNESGGTDDQHAPLRNIYACLVHENENCINDLIRNLHYHDPSSTILLYNGSGNAGLVGHHISLEKFGVVVHPNPVGLKHGYLHPFALGCMQFALENFSFDTLTIVDSDQLAIRSGYSEYLGKFLSSQSNTGILSSNPERVIKGNTDNLVAAQAFKEYDLWKPLLNSFSEGDSKFVHWTFWPSCVFTSGAARDLVQLFKKNELLQEIMKRSKIWASEEVILPTLTRLLGYEIVSNPCSYDFVKYQKGYSLQELNCAFTKTDAYWIHPVTRKYTDPIRKSIREKFNNYDTDSANNSSSDDRAGRSFSRPQLLKEINSIEGWLSEREADLLITTTINACKDLPPPYTIVEIGSYHGKSTILFGNVTKKLFPGTKIYAIDNHDGKLGAADQGLQSFPPSFEFFKTNIEKAGLSEVVELIKDNSYNVSLQVSISLLFIDGLHDYLNVARDFSHFSRWVRPDGYVAFHDYVTYFPGVMKFVRELLATGSYRAVGKADSLIVIQKI